MIDSPSSRRIRRTILLSLSLVGFIAGGYLLWNTWAFSLSADETRGQIVSRDGARFTIEYSVDGRRYQITEELPSTKGASGLKRGSLQPGTPVSVLYDPSSPATARWNANRHWVFPISILAISALAGFAAIFPGLAGSLFQRG